MELSELATRTLVVLINGQWALWKDLYTTWICNQNPISRVGSSKHKATSHILLDALVVETYDPGVANHKEEPQPHLMDYPL